MKVFKNKILMGFAIATVMAMLSSQAGAVEINYGFAPQNPASDDISAYGTGMNHFIEGTIAIDPSADPMLTELGSVKVVGVRAFLRADYKQKNKKFSAISAYEGSLETTPTLKYVNFDQGWNTNYFDEPIILGQDPIYVGVKVYETKGTPYPLVAYSKASVAGGFNISMKGDPFNEYTDRGTLLIEAILEVDAEPQTHALVQASGYPLAIEPDTDFGCNLYIRNQGAAPISSLQLLTEADDGDTQHIYDVSFDEDLGGYDGRLIDFALRAPCTEGEDVGLTLSVVGVNGMTSGKSMANEISLYVSQDAFLRVPLIEEFTGMTCSNCPFMAYYLDIALEDFGKNHVYVAHHAGFQNDLLTQPVDEALLYLFGPEGYTYNPAVMFDRRILDGNALPVIAAREASAEPYSLCLAEAMKYPAQAKVLVDMAMADGKATCRVHGRVARSLLESPADYYVSAYIVENGLTVDDYFQFGISDGVAEGAPDDLIDRFRHNGVIRVNLSSNDLGDKLEVDADGKFDINYDAVGLEPTWRSENLRTVAFVHRLNPEVITDNVVLNAGANDLNSYVDPAHQQGIALDEDYDINAYIDACGNLKCNVPVRDMRIYDLSGRQVTAPVSAGCYVVDIITTNGIKVAKKVIR